MNPQWSGGYPLFRAAEFELLARVTPCLTETQTVLGYFRKIILRARQLRVRRI